VLRGVDAAFEKWRSRKSKVRAINSLAYCAQEVLAAAQAMPGVAAPQQPGRPAAAPFELDELQAFLTQCAAALRATGKPAYEEIASVLSQLAAEAEAHYENLEDLERRLTALEDKMIAIGRSRQSEADLLAARRALDMELRPYRSKMTAAQLSMLETQYLDRRLLEAAALPRLSLFYLR
jgi:hypothetical protein